MFLSFKAHGKLCGMQEVDFYCLSNVIFVQVIWGPFLTSSPGSVAVGKSKTSPSRVLNLESSATIAVHIYPAALKTVSERALVNKLGIVNHLVAAPSS